VAGKNGPKFPPSAPDAVDRATFDTNGRSIGRTMPKTTMAELADTLTANAGLDRSVIDRTGLAGFYSLHLIYTPESRRAPAGVVDATEITIFNAVRDQLGLRVEKQTAPVEMLVIDRVERATEN
jgi:uncharacterized protein (TIGR03435 family)